MSTLAHLMRKEGTVSPGQLRTGNNKTSACAWEGPALTQTATCDMEVDAEENRTL